MPKKSQMLRADGVILVQLATRIPKELHRQTKIYCVRTDMSVMELVTTALQERLKRLGSRPE